VCVDDRVRGLAGRSGVRRSRNAQPGIGRNRPPIAKPTMARLFSTASVKSRKGQCEHKVSAVHRRSQPVDATLYLEGEMSVI
jgi:hypothetical protein